MKGGEYHVGILQASGGKAIEQGLRRERRERRLTELGVVSRSGGCHCWANPREMDLDALTWSQEESWLHYATLAFRSGPLLYH
jgi:hypothetical protein